VFSYIERQPGQAAAWLIAGFSLLHLLVIGIPDLTNDEAQYALYGYYLDWSYFDHPPMVGWLNALILPFSDSDFALRLWPVVLSAVSSALLYGLTRDIYSGDIYSPNIAPNSAGWIATLSVVIFQSGLIFQVLAMAMLPDTPLIPVSIAAGWALLRAFRDGWTWGWLLIGLLLGLAGLSKYTAVTLVITALLGLFIFRQQKILLTVWPWLAVMVASLVILPVIYWNANHDWISIQYQLGHGMPQKNWEVSRFLLSQLGQFLAYSPGIFVFGYLASLAAIRFGSAQEQFILALGLPVLLLFGWNSGYETSLLHWTAVGWAALTPLIAHWIYQHRDLVIVRISAYTSFGYSIIVIVVFHSLLAFNWLPFSANKHPLNDIYGWSHVATVAKQLRAEMQQHHPQTNAVIMVGNWSIFSRLAWYARPEPVQVTDTRFGQSDIWYGEPRKGDNGIVVVPPKYLDKPNSSGINHFSRCHKKQSVIAEIHNKPAATYDLYACYGYDS